MKARLNSLLLLLPALAAGGTPTPGPTVEMEGFALPQPGRVFAFPRDHGSHPDFRLEW